MNTSATQATSYSITWLTADVTRTFEDFPGHYERVPQPVPMQEVDALVARCAVEQDERPHRRRGTVRFLLY